jgi:hypothetical protein
MHWVPPKRIAYRHVQVVSSHHHDTTTESTIPDYKKGTTTNIEEIDMHLNQEAIDKWRLIDSDVMRGWNLERVNRLSAADFQVLYRAIVERKVPPPDLGKKLPPPQAPVTTAVVQQKSAPDLPPYSEAPTKVRSPLEGMTPLAFARKTAAARLPVSAASTPIGGSPTHMSPAVKTPAYMVPVASRPPEGAGSISQPRELETLSGIIKVLAANAEPLSGYDEHRIAWLTAHFRLNSEGTLAPLFRPRLPPSQRPTTAEQITFSRDRQVIDLHWLHCSGYRAPIGEAEFATLLLDEEFDWAAAEAFAQRSVTTQVKAASWLALGELCGWQLASIQTKAIRTRHSAIMNGDRTTAGVPGVRAALADIHAGKPNSRVLQAEDLMLWRVNMMLGDARTTSHAKLFALAMGHPQAMTPRHFQRRQDRALREMKAALSRS